MLNLEEIESNFYYLRYIYLFVVVVVGLQTKSNRIELNRINGQTTEKITEPTVNNNNNSELKQVMNVGTTIPLNGCNHSFVGCVILKINFSMPQKS